MRKLWIAVLLLLIVVAIAVSVQTVKRSLFGEEKETFTLEGTVNTTTYSTMPQVPLLEIFHDGEKVVLFRIEKVVAGVTPFPQGSQIALTLADYSKFGGSGFDGKKFRIKLTRFVEGYGYEYWTCSAKEI
jgi:hypothetical protein